MDITVSLSAGGLGIIAQLACVRTLLPHLKQTTRFAGCSSGALVALALAVKLPSSELRRLEDTLNANDIIPIERWYTPWRPWLRLLYSFGMYRSETLRTTILSMLVKYGMDERTTFLDVKKRTGNELVVAVMNLSKQRPVLLSVCATPGMSILDAVLASACIPVLLIPITAHTQVTDIRDGLSLISPGDLLCDGGFAFHNPDEQLDGHFCGGIGRTLSITIREYEDIAYEARTSLPVPTTITQCMTLLVRAHVGVITTLADQLLVRKPGVYAATIDIPKWISVGTLLTLEQRTNLLEAGMRGARAIIEDRSDQSPFGSK
jgi:hypothetical protein